MTDIGTVCFQAKYSNSLMLLYHSELLMKKLSEFSNNLTVLKYCLVAWQHNKYYPMYPLKCCVLLHNVLKHLGPAVANIVTDMAYIFPIEPVYVHKIATTEEMLRNKTFFNFVYAFHSCCYSYNKLLYKLLFGSLRKHFVAV